MWVSEIPSLTVDRGKDYGQNTRKTDERGMCADPAHHAAEISQEAAVESRERTAGEGEFGSAIVGKQGVGVLQEGDQDDPVIYPKATLVDST